MQKALLNIARPQTALADRGSALRLALVPPTG